MCIISVFPGLGSVRQAEGRWTKSHWQVDKIVRCGKRFV